MEIWFDWSSTCICYIATIFCTWHDSSAVVPCANLCSDHYVRNFAHNKVKIFQRIYITLGKSLLRWASASCVILSLCQWWFMLFYELISLMFCMMIINCSTEIRLREISPALDALCMCRKICAIIQILFCNSSAYLANKTDLTVNYELCLWIKLGFWIVLETSW